MSVFSIYELKSEILKLRKDMMYIDQYKKYLHNHPDTYYYNIKENIYIRKSMYSNTYIVYDVIPEKQCLIYRRGYII